MKIISFELKKLYQSTFFRIMLLGLLIFILVYYVFVYINTVRVDELIQDEISSIDIAQKELTQLKEAIDSGEVASDDRKVLERIDDLNMIISDRKTRLNAYQEEDWEALLNLEVINNEEFVSKRIFEGNYNTYTWQTLFSMESQHEWNKLMRDKGIAPIFHIHGFSWMTVYDEVFQDEIMEEAVKNWSTKYSSAGVYYLDYIFGMLFTVFGVGFFVFLFGDVVTKEGLHRNGPIHLLYTQPINRKNILIGKFLTVSLVSIMILLGIAILSLLLGGIFDRLGDWEYPVLIYGNEYSFSFMNMGTFLLKSAALFFMILIFSYSILFLFSSLTKRILPAVGLTIATIFIGIRLGEEAAMSSIAPYIPFQYFSVPKVISNEIAVTLKNYEFSFANGMVSLSITSLIVLVMTYIVYFVQTKFGN